MLVRVTNSCRMGCSHCLVDATPEGAHMEFRTFRQTVAFADKVSSPVLLISGGEPTDHPDILKFLEFAKIRKKSVLLLSNGMFLEDNKKRDAILTLVYGVQITNDPRFYPKKILRFDHPKIEYENKIRMIEHQGRAEHEHFDFPDLQHRSAPGCFNLRSATRKLGLRAALKLLREEHHKFCSPTISINGDIVAGESPFCTVVGNVVKPINYIQEKIANMRCSKCGLVNNLGASHKLAIGEL